MIRYLNGILAEKEANMVVVEVNGIGYEVNVPGNSSVFLRQVGEEVKLYTHLQISEDDMVFYGFMTTGELKLYKQLITVNSVGGKGALAILSSMPLSEIKKAIVFEDVDMITRAKGIGKKTAQKIVLELKDKMGDVISSKDDDVVISTADIPMSDTREEAVDALLNLGFTRVEAMSAMLGAGDDLDTEGYIKYALKNRG